ncbi:hypothetical protein HKX48_002814 [Thoreauomyces humboldtii]|nr:hypothetical protein HKX48_002814 [Thoreauomyces humboldtii]
MNTGEVVRSFKDHTRAVEDIVFSDDGLHLFSASSDTTIKKWDLGTGNLVATLQGHLTSVYVLALSDGCLWSASADKTAQRWDLETNLPEDKTKLEHPDFVRSLAVFPNGGYVVTGGRDENVRIWDVASGECLKTLSGHFAEVSDIKIRGATIWTASLDGTIRTWPITEKDLKPNPDARTAITAAEAAPAEATKRRGNKKAVKMTEEEERELAELMGSDDDDM